MAPANGENTKNGFWAKVRFLVQRFGPILMAIAGVLCLAYVYRSRVIHDGILSALVSVTVTILAVLIYTAMTKPRE